MPRTGAALDFDGSNDDVVTNLTTMNASAWTIEAWAKLNTLNPGTTVSVILAKWNATGSNRDVVISYQKSPNQFFVSTRNESAGVGAGIASTVNPVANTWYHLALSYDGTTLTFYIDGVVQGTDTTPNMFDVTNDPFIIGDSGNNTDPWNGNIDDVRIWDYARSGTGITDFKDCELDGNESMLRAYYDFNQGTAGGNNSSETTLYDKTANANDGTLNGFALSGSSSNWIEPGGVVNGTNCYTVTVTAEITGDSTGCGSVVLTASGGDTYDWSTGETTAQITVTATDTYSVTVTDSASGASDSTSQTVTLSIAPSISFIEIPCGLIASGGNSYAWDTDDSTAFIIVTDTGSYTVTATINATGCTSTETYTITTLLTPFFYKDVDGDGFGVTDSVIGSCVQPVGYVSAAGDCDDTNADIYPGAEEICDNVDNNCNNILIEGDCPGNDGEVASVCSIGEDVLTGEGFFNYGSVSKGLNAVHRLSATVGQPLVDNAFTPDLNLSFGFWSRFLLVPSAPLVQATEGELPDRNELNWEPDPLSPETTISFNIYRNGSLLSTVGPEVRSFLDFNVIAGEFYTYEVTGINLFGEGYKGSALGFLNPNGVVTGKVETFTGNPVPGAVVTLTPTIGTALSFDGQASSFVEYDTLFPRDVFTFSCWVKLGDGNDGSAIVDLGSHLGKNWWLHTLSSASGKGVAFGIGRDTGDVTELSYEFPVDGADDWHYVAASYSGAALLLYVDGELIETAVAEIESDSSRLFLGQTPNTMQHYMGKLDELRFFDRQLPQTEIQMLMDKSASSETPGLVSYWKFDEGTGSKGFNVSKNKFTAFHCGTAWTSDKPLVVNAGITDETGFYKIEGINYGSGTTFTAIPTKNFYLNQSLEFNGVNESYADLTDFDLPDTAAVTVTVKAFDYSGNQAILSKADAGGNNRFVLCLNAGNLDLILDGQTQTYGSLDMGYHHLAVNLFQNGSSVQADIYKNGSLLGSQTFSGVSTDWTGMPWKAAARADGMGGHTDYFTGLIDEVAFFNMPLELHEIQEYANIGTDVTHLGITSVFCFNEGEGTTVSDTGPAFSGTGTIHGATWSTVTDVNETLAHEFLPGSRLVTLNPSNTATDKVDFIDQSTIPVSGFVRFEGTRCFQKKVEILVNGSSYSPLIFTDEDGKFVSDFEPGVSIQLAPKFEDHNYNINFWELKNLSRPVAGILFQNLVKRKITGQIAGGYCRKSVIPDGSIVQIKVATLNGCYERVHQFDPTLEKDGEFTFAGVPPDSVTIALVQHSNPIIYNYFQIQGAPTLDLRIEDDTADFIYFAPPEVEIEPLDTNSCSDPMLNQLQQTSTKVKVFENYDGGKCYLDTALLTINNEIAELGQFDTLMAEGEFTHRFKVGLPNIVSPYVKTLQVTAEAHDEQATETVNAVVLANGRGKQLLPPLHRNCPPLF